MMVAAMIEDELEALKQSLIVTLDMIPETAYVGLITFGTVVQLYDLAYTSCVKSYVFKGDKEITTAKVTSYAPITTLLICHRSSSCLLASVVVSRVVGMQTLLSLSDGS